MLQRVVQAEFIAIILFQFSKYIGGNNGPAAKDQERQMNAMNHLRRARVKPVRHEHRREQRPDRDAKADGHLLHRAGDGARAAGLFFRHVRIDQRVHAGILERGEHPKNKYLRHDEPDRRACANRREGKGHHAEHHGVENQNAAIAEALQNFSQHELQTQRGGRLRHDEQAGLDRREAKTDLIQQRKQKRNSADAQSREKTTADRRAKSADAKQLQPQQGKLDAPRPHSVSDETNCGHGQQRQQRAAAQRMFAKHFQHICQQPDAQAEQNQSAEIERRRIFLPVIGQMAIDKIKTKQADRQVDEKNQPPMKITDDESAGDRAEHRADQTGNRHEAHCADEFGFWKCPHQCQSSHRHHHRPTETLQNATRHEQMDAVRDATQ